MSRAAEIGVEALKWLVAMVALVAVCLALLAGLRALTGNPETGSTSRTPSAANVEAEPPAGWVERGEYEVPPPTHP